MSPLLPTLCLLAAPPVAEMGTLRLETGRADVPLFIDGAPAGLSPLPGPWTLPPGRHTLEARPKGAPVEKVDVDIKAGQATGARLLTAALPAPISPEAAAAAEADAAPGVRVVHKGPGFSLARAGYVSAGVGLAAGITSVLFGLDANAKADEANGLDRRNPATSREDLESLNADADRSAFISNLTLGVAIVGVVTGGAMLFLASDGPFGTQDLALGATPGGAFVGGRF